MMRSTVLAIWLLLALAASAWAANPGAPTAVVAVDDEEDDKGTWLTVSWTDSTDPPPEGMHLVGYQIMAGPEGGALRPARNLAPEVVEEEGGAVELKPWPWPAHMIAVAAVYAIDGQSFNYLVDEDGNVKDANISASRAVVARSDTIGPVRPVGIWYDAENTNVLVILLLYATIVIVTIRWMASRAADAYIRPIAGLEAVNDAIGRATEMGKPIVYVSGLSGIGSISTIASMLILGHLSKRTAHYGTDIIVPCNDALVMSAEREIVRQSYLEAGKPDAYKPENIFFLTDSQFGYVAAVDGIMMREKPAACFYMGYFYAEALILAETGNDTGAIQIAGTDADTQLPFFITACDYTLMGEELYAASAYLSRHPLLLAQLRGQDIGKSVLAALLVVGAIAATWAAFGADWAEGFIKWFA